MTLDSGNGAAGTRRPAILLSAVKNKSELERKIAELGGCVVTQAAEATHLVMGGDGEPGMKLK